MWYLFIHKYKTLGFHSYSLLPFQIPRPPCVLRAFFLFKSVSSVYIITDAQKLFTWEQSWAAQCVLSSYFPIVNSKFFFQFSMPSLKCLPRFFPKDLLSWPFGSRRNLATSVGQLLQTAIVLPGLSSLIGALAQIHFLNTVTDYSLFILFFC